MNLRLCLCSWRAACFRTRRAFMPEVTSHYTLLSQDLMYFAVSRGRHKPSRYLGRAYRRRLHVATSTSLDLAHAGQARYSAESETGKYTEASSPFIYPHRLPGGTQMRGEPRSGSARGGVASVHTPQCGCWLRLFACEHNCSVRLLRVTLCGLCFLGRVPRGHFFSWRRHGCRREENWRAQAS